jgi:hypothetical protein
MDCTKASRKALTTVEVRNISEFTVGAVCTCMKTAVSNSLEGCLQILDRKHKFHGPKKRGKHK